MLKSMATIEFDFFGKDAQFHHLGLVVRSVAEICTDCFGIEDPVQRVKVAFVKLNGLKVELIEPLGKSSPVWRNLKNRVKLVHVCYGVPDIARALVECRNHGFHKVTNPVPAAAFDGRNIAWVFHKDFGLFELLENEEI